MKDNEKYQQLIGALLYLAVNTRPDITASVTILSQHNKNPAEIDWTEAKRVAHYLKGTKDYQLTLGNENGEKQLIGYADADWAKNREDRKSNSGYVFRYLNGTISWSCRKQTCVALSSTEAECIALAEACQESMWIQPHIARNITEMFLQGFMKGLQPCRNISQKDCRNVFMSASFFAQQYFMKYFCEVS